jgi:hypothetical protein
MLTLRRVFGMRKALTSHPEKARERFGLPADGDLVPALDALDETLVLKTHRLADPDNRSPAIYLTRDGRDAVVSYVHYTQGRGQAAYKDLDFDAALEKIITNSTRNGTWSENVRSWTERPGPTAVVRFERLIEDPSAAVAEALESLEIDAPSREGGLPSFEELQKRDPVMFRRGKSGTWREEMPSALEELFWEHHGAQMEALGYER